MSNLTSTNFVVESALKKLNVIPTLDITRHAKNVTSLNIKTKERERDRRRIAGSSVRISPLLVLNNYTTRTPCQSIQSQQTERKRTLKRMSIYEATETVIKSQKKHTQKNSGSSSSKSTWRLAHKN